jgi:hypothetical protein
VSSKKLIFEWTLAEATKESLEARWIAADTSGLAPADYTIASTKSAAGKSSGQFSLGQPSDGFPPGAYRLEVWRSGKLLHFIDFAIND